MKEILVILVNMPSANIKHYKEKDFIQFIKNIQYLCLFGAFYHGTFQHDSVFMVFTIFPSDIVSIYFAMTTELLHRSDINGDLFPDKAEMKGIQ